MRDYYQGVGPDYIDGPYIERLNKAILDSFEPKHKYAFFTICSWAKPYSASYIHNGIRKELHDNGLLDKMDYIHVSSGGIIPSEAELWACFYDWNNEWIDDDITYVLLRKRIQERMQAFIDKFGDKYEKMFVYLRGPGNTYKVLDQFFMKVDPRFIAVPAMPYDTEVEKLRAYQVRHDPDDYLLCPSNLAYMSDTIRGIIKDE